MRRVSTIVLLMALGAQGFGTNQVLGQNKPSQHEDTSLQLSRWKQDGYRRQYGNQNDYTGPPSIYNEAPKSTDQGWWNEEKRTVGNCRDTRKYSNSKYGSSIVPVSSDKYDVTPDEWRSGNAYDNTVGYQRERTYRSNGSYQGNQGTGNFDGRQRQTLRANDLDRRAQPYQGYQQYGGNDYRYDGSGNSNSYNNYDPNEVTPSEWRDQQRQQGSNSGYNYGFGSGSRGEVVGTYDSASSYDSSYYQDNNYGGYSNNNMDRNDVTPQEWKDQSYNRQNDNMYYENQQGYYDQGYGQGYHNDDGLYDTTSQQGDWWNEEKRDFSTNLGRQETRSYSGSRPLSNNRAGVTPDEWNGDRRYDYSYDRRQQQPVNYYQDNRQGPNRPKDSWWGKMKRGFKNVGYNRNDRRRYDDRRRDGRYYDDRREYVTRRDPQDNDDWWKTEKVDHTTW